MFPDPNPSKNACAVSWPRAPRVEALRFCRAPLLVAALCFALGESLTQLPSPIRPTCLLLPAAIALATLTFVALRKTLRLALLPIAALWIAAGLWSAQVEPAPSPQTALLRYADGLSRTVTGRIVRIRPLPPRTAQTNDATGDFDWDQWDESDSVAPSTSIDLAVTTIEDVTPDTSRMVPITGIGGIRTTLFAASATQSADQPQLHCGELVSIPLRLRTPERYRDPGAWQYADSSPLTRTSPPPPTPPPPNSTQIPDAALHATTLHLSALNCRIFAAQTWAAAHLLDYVRSTPNRRLPALLRLALARRRRACSTPCSSATARRLTHTLRLGFERTGSFHLFVVSGMHIALLAGLLFYFARRLRLRRPRQAVK